MECCTVPVFRALFRRLRDSFRDLHQHNPGAKDQEAHRHGTGHAANDVHVHVPPLTIAEHRLIPWSFARAQRRTNMGPKASNKSEVTDHGPQKKGKGCLV